MAQSPPSPPSPSQDALSHCRVDSLDPSNDSNEVMHLSTRESAEQIDQGKHRIWESPEDIEALKDSAHERFEDFHAQLVVWNHFTKGLNGSMQRAHELLDRGEYDKAKETFERVIRTTDQFLKDHPS
ncbi:hypothetical protein DPSP01_007063 [Paraphaeosphaeria sporulosa]